jgi:hypothetical protein
MPDRDRETDRPDDEPEAGRVWERTKAKAREALEWGRKVSHVGKLKLDATRLMRERARAYEELGRRTHDLLRKGQFDPSALSDLVHRIDELTEEVGRVDREIEEAARKTQTDRA